MALFTNFKNSLKKRYGELDYPKVILLISLDVIILGLGLLVLFSRILPLIGERSFMKYHLFFMLILYVFVPIISLITLTKGNLIIASYITFIPTYISLIIVFFITGGVDSFVVPILIIISTFSFYNLHNSTAYIINGITLCSVLIDAIYSFTFQSDLIIDIPMHIDKSYKTVSFLIAIITITILFVFSVRKYYQIYNKEKIKEGELINSLKEKDLLLKEVHHRVKNNLQLIASLLSIQINHITKDDNFVDILKDNQNRIKTMGFVHNTLYKTNNLFDINALDYVERITKNITFLNRIKEKNISIITDIDNDLYINIDTAIPVGLIINEAVSNSIKYAFTEKHDEPDIYIRLAKNDDNFLLIISDNGIGLPDKYIPIKDSKSMGLELISLLSMQLHADLKIDNKFGTKYEILWIYNRKASLEKHK